MVIPEVVMLVNTKTIAVSFINNNEHNLGGVDSHGASCSCGHYQMSSLNSHQHDPCHYHYY